LKTGNRKTDCQFALRSFGLRPVETAISFARQRRGTRPERLLPRAVATCRVVSWSQPRLNQVRRRSPAFRSFLAVPPDIRYRQLSRTKRKTMATTGTLWAFDLGKGSFSFAILNSQPSTLN